MLDPVIDDNRLVEFAQFVAERIIDRHRLHEIPDYYFLLFQFRHPELKGEAAAIEYGKMCTEKKYPSINDLQC
jgi:hypothetical protein